MLSKIVSLYSTQLQQKFENTRSPSSWHRLWLQRFILIYFYYLTYFLKEIPRIALDQVHYFSSCSTSGLYFEMIAYFLYQIRAGLSESARRKDYEFINSQGYHLYQRN